METIEIVMVNKIGNSEKSIKRVLDNVFSVYHGRFKKEAYTIKTDKYGFYLSFNDSPVSISAFIPPEYLPELNVLKLRSQYHYFVPYNYKEQNYNYTEKEAQKNFFDFIDLAIAMMKASDNNYFIGSWENNGLGPCQVPPIQILFFRDKEYLQFLEEHIVYLYKISLSVNPKESLEIIDKLVKKHAFYFKKYGEFTFISFWPFAKKVETEGSPNVPFYKAIHKAIQELKKEGEK